MLGFRYGLYIQAVVNATISGWPSPGLISFGATSPGNYYMVQDGNPVESNTKGEWLLPMYGVWMEFELPLNTTHQNQKEQSGAIALVKNTDATMLKWTFSSWVNTGKPWGNLGGGCLPSRGTYWPATDNHDVCNPTETALVRLANGNLLTVWRDDPGYNTTLMAQVSKDDGHTWTTAAPLHGKISNGNYEMIVDAPFGVEPKLAMMDSGVLLLLTGRPRMYLWALPAGADPLTATWQPHDLGKLHNTAITEGGCTVAEDPPYIQRYGFDYDGKRLVDGVNATFQDCANICCQDQSCKAFAFGIQPGGSGGGGKWHECVDGSPCCNLKASVAAPTKNQFPGSRYGVVTRAGAATSAAIVDVATKQTSCVGSDVPLFPPKFWASWRGASDPSLRSTGCCTDAYTGLIALPGTDDIVITYGELLYRARTLFEYPYSCKREAFFPTVKCETTLPPNVHTCASLCCHCNVCRHAQRVTVPGQLWGQSKLQHHSFYPVDC